MIFFANKLYKRLTTPIFAFALLISLFAFTGCSTTTADSDQPATTEAKQVAEEDKDTLGKGRKVTITDNYSYKVPKGSEETDKRLGEEYTNEQNYGFTEANGNYVYITSFCISGEPECFPDLAEHLVYQGDEDAEMGYSTFGNTSMGTSHAEGLDDNGEKLYVTAYWWPDGGSTLCCVEIASYSKKSDVPDFVRSTIKGSGSASGEGEDTVVPPGAEGLLYPNYDEIMNDEIMNGYMGDDEGHSYEPYHW